MIRRLEAAYGHICEVEHLSDSAESFRDATLYSGTDGTPAEDLSAVLVARDLLSRE